MSKKKLPLIKTKKNLFRILFLLLFSLLLFLFPSPNIYFKTAQKTGGLSIPQKVDLPPPPLIPRNITNTSPPELSAEGIYIIDLPSNVVLYKKNEDRRFLPASTTKIATALVALDYYKLDDVLKVKTVVNDGRKMGLIAGEEITLESLLYGTLIHSANDAAYTIAENYPGGVEGFVDLMNKKASDLYLSDTHFTNPVGFDDEKNYTTPSDLARLAKAALDNKTIAKITSIKSITVSDANFTYFHPLNNVNELLGKIKGVAGVKTGFTDNAGEILVTEVKRNKRSILLVVLKSKDRFGETEKLINWIFGNFEWKDLKVVISNN